MFLIFTTRNIGLRGCELWRQHVRVKWSAYICTQRIVRCDVFAYFIANLIVTALWTFLRCFWPFACVIFGVVSWIFLSFSRANNFLGHFPFAFSVNFMQLNLYVWFPINFMCWWLFEVFFLSFWLLFPCSTVRFMSQSNFDSSVIKVDVQLQLPYDTAY